ncbi:transporter substrate-binding domain-containing protein [Streptomyces sp. NPDC060006]|uniref:transporter substrate-binding domain-containing protein n=1 Tax=unclassified Streptomyces TaxID=2593676 RepID=UPI0022AC884B|nr:transporter substrate-binding domain-containing protein [Streptomyces aurantiacus]WAU84962.1 transporter substrate-binding domain-containing protein [Streptomyces aurantiacus]
MSSKTRVYVAVAAFCAIVAVGLTLAVSSGSDDQDETFLGKERISVGMHNDLPGISYEENYRRSGLDQLLFEQIREGLGIKSASPSNVSSEGRIPALEKGEVDMVIAAFSITPERMKQVDFVGPYATTRQGFLVGPASTVRELKDLRGKTVCSWEGTTSDAALQEFEREGIQTQTLVDASDCIEALERGQVQAVSTDQMILYGFARHHVKDGLRVVPGVTIGAPQHYGIGLPKGHRKDCLELREFVKRYVESSDWIKDMETSLPDIPAREPGWISDYKPSDESIDARSCRDKPSA